MHMEERPVGINASDADSDETDFDGLKTLCEHGQRALAAIWMFFYLAEEGRKRCASGAMYPAPSVIRRDFERPN